jgi:site-specific DNA recombinase
VNAMSNTARAVVYLRVSTEHQAAADKFGLEVQRRACNDYAKTHGLTIAAEYADTISGTRTTREHLEALKRDSASFDAVIVSSVDRLARRVGIAYGVLGELLESGLEVHSADMGIIDPDDDASAMGFGIRALFGESDHRRIAKRLSAGIIQKVQSGKPVVPLSCYGWHRGEIVEAEAERLRWMFVEAQTRSLAKLALELNTLQIPTPSGKGKWQNSNILLILRNTVYKGLYQYGRKRKRRPGTRGRASCPVPPIVDEETWERTNRALDSRMTNRGQTGARRERFPLVGRMRCAVCNSAMTAVESRNPSGNILRYYKCWRSANRQDGNPLCTHKRLYHAEKLHARVLSDLKRLVRNPAALEASIATHAPRHHDLKPDRDRLQRRLDNAVKMRADGEISRDELAIIRRDVEIALEVIDAEQTRLSTTAPKPDVRAARALVQRAVAQLPLHQIADALRLLVIVAPDGSSGKQATLPGIYTYQLEL